MQESKLMGDKDKKKNKKREDGDTFTQEDFMNALKKASAPDKPKKKGKKKKKKDKDD
jgi:hypothetical protein